MHKHIYIRHLHEHVYTLTYTPETRMYTGTHTHTHTQVKMVSFVCYTTRYTLFFIQIDPERLPHNIYTNIYKKTTHPTTSSNVKVIYLFYNQNCTFVFEGVSEIYDNIFKNIHNFKTRVSTRVCFSLSTLSS